MMPLRGHPYEPIHPDFTGLSLPANLTRNPGMRDGFAPSLDGRIASSPGEGPVVSSCCFRHTGAFFSLFYSDKLVTFIIDMIHSETVAKTVTYNCEVP